MVNGNHKVGEDIRRILNWLFVLLMSAQILLGIRWMIVNIGHLPLFQETFLMNQASENLIVDEYMGILYPLLILATKCISKVIPIPYYTLLYIVQIFVAGFTAVYMLKYIGWIKGSSGFRKIKYVFVTGYFLTFPLLLQMHMAVLPYSFAMSIAVVLMCDGLYYLQNMDKVSGKVLIRLCGLWLLDVLLVPEYSWLLGVFTVGVLIRVLIHNREWRYRILICVLSTVLCFGVIETTTQTPGSLGRIQKSVNASMLSRFVWPNFSSYSYFWPEQIAETFMQDELLNISKYPEGVIYDFGYVMDKKYGREVSNDIYRKMSLTSLQLNTKQIMTDISRDFTAYLCPPAALQLQTANNHSSLLAWNYGRLQDVSPGLTKYYVNISFAGWNVMCILGMLIIVFKRGKRKIVYSHGIVLISILFMPAWYTMQGAGIQDYKKAMLLSFMWLIPVIKGFLLTEENMERNEDKGNE